MAISLRTSKHEAAKTAARGRRAAVAGKTRASASTMEPELRALAGDKSARAAKVGELIAQRAKDAGVTQVVFDRAGHQYHGRIAALADAAREAGLGL